MRGFDVPEDQQLPLQGSRTLRARATERSPLLSGAPRPLVVRFSRWRQSRNRRGRSEDEEEGKKSVSLGFSRRYKGDKGSGLRLSSSSREGEERDSELTILSHGFPWTTDFISSYLVSVETYLRGRKKGSRRDERESQQRKKGREGDRPPAPSFELKTILERLTSAQTLKQNCNGRVSVSIN